MPPQCVSVCSPGWGSGRRAPGGGSGRAPPPPPTGGRGPGRRRAPSRGPAGPRGREPCACSNSCARNKISFNLKM